MAFTMIEVGSFYANFLKNFNHKCVLNFVKGFFCTYWDYHMVLSFNLLIWCITLIDLCILKNPCIPGIKSTWSWFMSFLMCCWILFAKILVEDFCIYVHQWCSPVVFFFVCCLFLVLVSGWWWPCRMSLEVFLPLKFFERVLEG